MEIKKMLPYQRSLFILGDAGSERYALFRSYVSANAILERYWHPEDAVFKDCTWILFTDEEPAIFKLTKRGLTATENITAGGTYFISVLPGQLPLNTKLIFPPYFTDEQSFKDYYKEHPYRTTSSAFLWLEGFPYGKSDTGQQLRYLHDLHVPQNQISIAITQIERKFVMSDIGNLEVGITNAKAYFTKKGYRILSQHAVLPMQRALVFEALRHELNYAEKIMERQHELVERLAANLVFLEDDIRFVLEENGLLLKIDECFSYTKVKNKANVYDSWYRGLQDIYEKTVIPAVSEELKANYEIEAIQGPGAAAKELADVFKMVWKQFDMVIKKQKSSKAIRYQNELEYELAIKELKSKWRDTFYSTVKTTLSNECEHYLKHLCRLYTVEV